MPRNPRPEVPAQFTRLIESFSLHLDADNSAETVRIYTDAARWLAGRLPVDLPSWQQVTASHVQEHLTWMRAQGYAQGYRNNQGRALQAWFRWLAVEERIPNPFEGGNLRVPSVGKLGSSAPPVLAVEQVRAMLTNAEKGRTFGDLRDAAILRCFGSTGCRLAELAHLRLPEDVDLRARELVVVGKGSRRRTVRIDRKAAVALDRYIRARERHPMAEEAALWLGVRQTHGPLSRKGLYRVVKRRATAA